MKKGVKFYSLLAAGLIVVGGALYGIGNSMGGSVINTLTATSVKKADFENRENKEMGLFGWLKQKMTNESGNVVEGTITLEKFDDLVVENSSIMFTMTTGSEWKLDFCTFEGKEPEISRNGSKLTIKEPDGFNSWSAAAIGKTIRYSLTVPEGCKFNVKIETTSGAIAIKAEAAGSTVMDGAYGMELDGSIKATSGGIKIENIGLNGSVKSTSGGIGVSKVYGSSLTVDSTSGGIALAGAKYDKASLTSTSGAIGVTDLEVPDLKTETTSGGLGATNVTTKEYEHSTKSGGTAVKNITCEKIEIGSTSGSIAVEQCSTEIVKAESTSGSIRLGLEKVDEIKCKATSGSVNVVLPGVESDYSFDVHCTSGTIRIYDTKFGNEVKSDRSGKPVVINTTSGSVRIEF